MTRTVFCVKLQKEAEGLERPPLPGPLGKKVYEQISKEAWQAWQRYQTMLINKYRLNLLDPQARKFLQEQMEQFLFGTGAGPEAIPNYVPPQN